MLPSSTFLTFLSFLRFLVFDFPREKIENAEIEESKENEGS